MTFQELRMAISNDAPIELPDEDRFGLDPFARSIATCIDAMTAPNGLVLAINGSWGCGKSSAINLIQHHLALSKKRGDLVTVTFNPWWFAGEQALTLAFFQELNADISPSLPYRLSRSLTHLGRKI